VKQPALKNDERKGKVGRKTETCHHNGINALSGRRALWTIGEREQASEWKTAI